MLLRIHRPIIWKSASCLDTVLNMPDVISVETPIGLLFARGSDAITHLGWTKKVKSSPNALLREAQRQIEAYFLGELKRFDLPLLPQGTSFQCQIWQHLKSIPYGNTVSYGALGTTMSTSARAIGGACGANPIPLLIPCHRIVGQDGHLTGYSGGNGLQTKKQLLVLEKRYLNNSRSAPTQ